MSSFTSRTSSSVFSPFSLPPSSDAMWRSPDSRPMGSSMKSDTKRSAMQEDRSNSPSSDNKYKIQKLVTKFLLDHDCKDIAERYWTHTLDDDEHKNLLELYRQVLKECQTCRTIGAFVKRGKSHCSRCRYYRIRDIDINERDRAPAHFRAALAIHMPSLASRSRPDKTMIQRRTEKIEKIHYRIVDAINGDLWKESADIDIGADLSDDDNSGDESKITKKRKRRSRSPQKSVVSSRETKVRSQISPRSPARPSLFRSLVSPAPSTSTRRTTRSQGRAPTPDYSARAPDEDEADGEVDAGAE